MRIVGAIALLGGLALIGWLGAGEGEIDLSPLSTIRVEGAANYLNPGTKIELRSADVVVDGLFDNQYLLELPAGPHLVEVRLPAATICDRVEAAGSGSQQPGCEVEIQIVDSAGGALTQHRIPWKETNGHPPTLLLKPPAAFQTIRMKFFGNVPVTLHSINLRARVTRFRAWAMYADLQLIGPWLVGMATAAAMLGWGALLLRSRQEFGPSLLCRQMLLGAAVVPAFGVVWLQLPASARTGGLGATVVCAALLPSVRHLYSQLRRTTPCPGLWSVLCLNAMLLLATVAADSTVVANRRVKPMDHLFGLLGSQHLLAGVPMTNEMNLRPWYVSTLSSPVVALFGDKAYWFYLGQMAFLNSLALIPVAAWAERWKQPSPVRTAALVALFPAIGVLHFSGQRPFAAGLMLAAVLFWTNRAAKGWWIWGGLASALAVLAHPGSLFLLPPAALYFLVVARGERLQTCLLGLMLPLTAYAAWSVGIRSFHPETRNYLLYYPIMRTLDDVPPDGKSIVEVLRNLPAENWRELATNRLHQLRHYVWANNPWHNEPGETFRPVSLTSTLGATATLSLFWLIVRRSQPGDGAFYWLAVVGPLLLFHGHIGQAFPQFHILPTPFIALAAVLAAGFDGLPKWVRTLTLTECFLRQLYPLWILFLQPFEETTWFGVDPNAAWIPATIPVLVWLLLWQRWIRS